MRTNNLHKLVIVSLLVLLVASTASAYTIVLRSGRRVEVPEKFQANGSSLTYEVSPGVQVSLAIAAIDVNATDAANGEPAGSFLQRLHAREPEPAPVRPRRTTATRTITNRDLESAMRHRRNSEAAYEVRRKELGLPSVAESQKQVAAESDSFSAELAQRRVAENQNEQYWRQRAQAFRADAAALDAEIAFVRARLEETAPNPWSNASITTVTSGPFGGWGNGRWGGYGTSGVWRGQGGIYGNRGGIFGGPYGGYPTYPGGIYGMGIPANDYSYERSELITRYNQLGAQRAGLQARWRQLEDEARRAGAQPGWLRP